MGQAAFGIETTAGDVAIDTPFVALDLIVAYHL